MIRIVEKYNVLEVTKPHYLMTFNYMIGDADGHTEEAVQISLDNPYIERFFTLMNSLRPVGGTWGIILNRETLDKMLKENQVSLDDYLFLRSILFFEEVESEDDEDEKDSAFKYEFYEGVLSEVAYKYVVFEGLTLEYIDEYGMAYNTEIE